MFTLASTDGVSTLPCATTTVDSKGIHGSGHWVVWVNHSIQIICYGHNIHFYTSSICGVPNKSNMCKHMRSTKVEHKTVKMLDL